MAGLFISLFVGCKTEVDAPAAGKPDNNTNNGNNKKIVHIYEEISYNSDNVIQSRNVYTNDENGNLVNKIVYNEDGSIRDEYIYKYENNLLIKTLYYDEIDQGPTYFTYEYDQNGNIIYEITNNTSDNTRKKLHKYVYNDKNQLVKEIYFESGIDDETDPDNISNICEYTYDENAVLRIPYTFTEDEKILLVFIHSSLWKEPGPDIYLDIK